MSFYTPKVRRKAKVEYGKRHLLDHIRATGATDAQIEEWLDEIPAEHPLKEHFVKQHQAQKAAAK